MRNTSSSRFSRLTPAVLFAAAFPLLDGCGVPDEDLAGAPAPRIAGDVLLDPPRPSRPLSQALGPNGHHILFLNFEGQTLQPGYDDAMRNVSSVAASRNRSVTIPPFNATYFSQQKTRDQVIADVVALTSQYFAPFNIDVVTSRPANPNYVMCMVGGLPDVIGYPCQGGACVGGIAPLDCQLRNGRIAYNPGDDVEVVYAFSDTTRYQQGAPYNIRVQIVAATIAQETAHAYGLGHENNVRDVMHPSTTGMTTGFRDEASPYADAQNCANGQGTQNSYQLLLQVLGANKGMMPMADVTAPTITIAAPTAGATLGRTFRIDVRASDNIGVERVLVQIVGPQGWSDARTLLAAPYAWDIAVPRDGAYTIQATAFDKAQNQQSAQVMFNVTGPPLSGFGSPCTQNAQCASGVCAGGICNQACGSCPMGYRCNAQKVCETDDATPPPAPMAGAVGAMCMVGADCTSNVCAETQGTKFCTDVCDPTDAASCPQGMFCSDLGSDGYYCVPLLGTRSNSGGGCGVGPGAAVRGPLSSSQLALIALALMLLGRRRAR